MKAKATYSNGVARVSTQTMDAEVNVILTARLVADGVMAETSHTDAMALAAGFLALWKECRDLGDELKAAQAGGISLAHATEIQAARKVIAELNTAAEAYQVAFESGEGTTPQEDAAMAEARGAAHRWLIADARACGARMRLIEGAKNG